MIDTVLAANPVAFDTELVELDQEVDA